MVSTMKPNKEKIWHEILKLSSEYYEDLGDKLLAYINLVKRITSFENGFISKIEGQDYLVLQSSTINNKLRKGDVFRLCDTLCQEVVDNKDTVIHLALEGMEQYQLPGRAYLDTESVIGTPIFVDDKVVGTLTVCSTSIKDNPAEMEWFGKVLEVIAGQISQLVRSGEVLDKIEEDRLLLDMGADLMKMATYKRYLESGNIECTGNFYKFFELEEGSVPAFEKILPKIHPDDRAISIKNFKKSKDEDVPPFEYRVVKEDGSYLNLRHEVRCEKGKGYILGIIHDITEMRKSEKDLNRKNKELEQFAYATAHDLQEPLRTISSFSERLKGMYEQKGESEAKLYMKFLTEAAHRMNEQINGLLNHSRLGRNPQVKWIVLSEMLDNIRQDFAVAIEEKDARISLEGTDRISALEVELRMLFQNLISNALKFSHPDRNPVIHIEGRDKGNYWEFTVQDNGIGIREKDLGKIFNLFGRLHSRSKYEGTGIGLTHCKKIVELHEGEISASSEHGFGTTFVFTLKKNLSV